VFPFAFWIKTKAEGFLYFSFNEKVTLQLNEHDSIPDGLEWIPLEIQIPFQPIASIVTWQWKNHRDSLPIFPYFLVPPAFSLALHVSPHNFFTPFHAFSIPIFFLNDTLHFLFKKATNQSYPHYLTVHLLKKQYDPLNSIETYYGLYFQNYRLSHSSHLFHLPLMNLEEGHYILFITYLDAQLKERVYTQYAFYVVTRDFHSPFPLTFHCYPSPSYPGIVPEEEIPKYIGSLYDCVQLRKEG
jgi:hypothetical protein